MKYLDGIDIAEVLGRSNGLIESFATVTGETAKSEATPAAADVVPGEVVTESREDAA